jgi:hypothetical protein
MNAIEFTDGSNLSLLEEFRYIGKSTLRSLNFRIKSSLEISLDLCDRHCRISDPCIRIVDTFSDMVGIPGDHNCTVSVCANADTFNIQALDAHENRRI